MKTVVWDFDYTLFDAARFKQDLKEAVVHQGVPPEKFDETYKAVVNRGDMAYDYDPEAHLELLAGEFATPDGLATARAGINRLLADTSRYVFAGAESVLSRVRASGYGNVLVTMGNRDWQQAKVDNSGIRRLIDRVISVDGSKVQAVAEMAKNGEVVVVNDNGQEIAEIREAVPEAQYILVSGPKGKPAELDLDPVVGLAGIEAALQIDPPLPDEGQGIGRHRT